MSGSTPTSHAQAEAPGEHDVRDYCAFSQRADLHACPSPTRLPTRPNGSGLYGNPVRDWLAHHRECRTAPSSREGWPEGRRCHSPGWDTATTQFRSGGGPRLFVPPRRDRRDRSPARFRTENLQNQTRLPSTGTRPTATNATATPDRRSITIQQPGIPSRDCARCTIAGRFVFASFVRCGRILGQPSPTSHLPSPPLR